MSESGPANVRDRGEASSIRRVVAASFIGTTIEWYDFFLYGTAAALVFNKLFFPKAEPSTGTLLALGTYGVGFFARPVGGIIFGHFGDRIGRKAMLVLSLVIMGIATFLIGLMPTYNSIGLSAAVILVVLRLAQGIGVGGEWGGAVLMSVEHAPSGRRGFYGSWPQMGVPAGLFLSTVVFALVQGLTSEQQFLSWGWRVPFLLSIVLVGVGLFVRLRLMESPAFQRVKDTETQAPMPILDVLRKYPREVLLAMGMRIAENGIFYILTVFSLVYGAEHLEVSRSTVLWAVAGAALIGIAAIPAYGAWSDRIGRRPLYLGGAVFSLLFAFPFFWLMNTKATLLIWLAVILGVNLGHDMMYGPQAAYFSELFGTRVRYTGASLGYQLASVFAGGLAPLIAAALLKASGYVAVAVYMAVMAVITIVATWLASETHQTDIEAENEAERELASQAQARQPQRGTRPVTGS
jgi:MFS transporter, MHS family, shikimate and dehydroshikimate transport protein